MLDVWLTQGKPFEFGYRELLLIQRFVRDFEISLNPLPNTANQMQQFHPIYCLYLFSKLISQIMSVTDRLS